MGKIFKEELQEKVKEFLTDYPSLRDNDSRLIVNIWAEDIGRKELNSMSASDLMIMISNDELPSGSTIRRVRRKLQENDEDLRGEKWEIRHNKLEPQVKEELKNWRVSYD
jgi:hypothetical protein